MTEDSLIIAVDIERIRRKIQVWRHMHSLRGSKLNDMELARDYVMQWQKAPELSLTAYILAYYDHLIYAPSEVIPDE